MTKSTMLNGKPVSGRLSLGVGVPLNLLRAGLAAAYLR
jgi:hypothetical protein